LILRRKKKLVVPVEFQSLTLRVQNKHLPVAPVFLAVVVVLVVNALQSIETHKAFVAHVSRPNVRDTSLTVTECACWQAIPSMEHIFPHLMVPLTLLIR
jgi:hypothetical protein